ncbi:MAG: hypothetical protein HKO56_07360 [Bacteroidia bacterium]|nr:TRL-like family protein [Bacteroidia bacterium]NNC86818.1 hypothetical protein [Bacteroidia bacterium]NNM16458.1 hypothetical protein [Bacteroidia bacterium]
MKNLKLFLMGLAVSAFFASCSITYPVNATSNSVGSKVGKSKATCYLSVLCFDQDASIKSAAKNGGITKISTVDINYGNILGIIVTWETIVTGE